MFGWKLFEVASKRWDVDFVPLRVGPFVFCLKIVSKVCAVDVETDICIQISVVSNLVDGDRLSGRRDMCRGARIGFALGSVWNFVASSSTSTLSFASADRIL